jgi:hypothetical protein
LILHVKRRIALGRIHRAFARGLQVGLKLRQFNASILRAPASQFLDFLLHWIITGDYKAGCVRGCTCGFGFVATCQEAESNQQQWNEFEHDGIS